MNEMQSNISEQMKIQKKLCPSNARMIKSTKKTITIHTPDKMEDGIYMHIVMSARYDEGEKHRYRIIKRVHITINDDLSNMGEALAALEHFFTQITPIIIFDKSGAHFTPSMFVEILENDKVIDNKGPYADAFITAVDTYHNITRAVVNAIRNELVDTVEAYLYHRDATMNVVIEPLRKFINTKDVPSEEHCHNTTSIKISNLYEIYMREAIERLESISDISTKIPSIFS